MTLVWRPGFAYDTDASNYIDAVEAADQADTPGIGAMETSVRYAINDFVIGCKNDGVWTAIKNSCILAGAKTLEGSFIDLKSCTKVITNNNFADGTYVGSNYTTGDYNRETGLLGNGTTKYLDSNRNNNADPQNSRHLAVYRSQAGATAGAGNGGLIGTRSFASGHSHLVAGYGNFSERLTNATSSSRPVSTATGAVFYGASRTGSANYQVRLNNVSYNFTFASATPVSENIYIFDVAFERTDARLAFYSIGESLDLALLDTRVSTLIAQFGAVIP